MFDCYVKRVTENGQAIFPTKYKLDGEDDDEAGIKSLARLKLAKGAYQYACQYLNDPVDEDTIEFKRHWFRTYENDQDTAAKLLKASAILSIDPAFRLRETNDSSGLVVTKVTSDNFVYVVEAIGRRMNAGDLTDEIFRLVSAYQPRLVLLETAVAQVVLLHHLREEMRKRNIFFPLEECKGQGKENKAMRIRGLIPHYSAGRILHRRDMVDLEAQLTEFPRAAHDDIVDALSFQVPHWRPISETVAPRGIPHGSYKWWLNHVPEKKRDAQFKGLVKRRAW